MPKRKANPTGRAQTTGNDSETVFFYLPGDKPYGVFCQWYSSSIVLPTKSLDFLVTKSTATPSPSTILSTYSPSLIFSCAEQLYMFSKALFFSDQSSCTRILSTSDPKEQKALGRQVSGYNEYKWTRVKSRVVRVGNWYKFCQNKHLRDVLLGTGEREIAEAARRDRVWGIGYNAEDAETYRKNWGENRLGRALMDVRKRVREMVEREERWEEVEWEWDGDGEVDGENGEGEEQTG